MKPSVRAGNICVNLPSVSEIQTRALANAQALPGCSRAIENPATYPVRRAPDVLELRERASQQHAPDHMVR